ncbi:MAG: hypothetical protein ACRD25_06680 [Terracidiphilus sp.]
MASAPARTSSGWLREPALDPRRLMPPPRHGDTPERSFSPGPARTEPQGAPPAQPAEHSRNGMPARPSQPARPASAPPPDRAHGRFTERQAPPESIEPERAEPQDFFAPRSSARPPRIEPEARATAAPPPRERQTEAAPASRFIAPAPSEPRPGREPVSEPKATRSAEPPPQKESFEIEPALPIVPPLWERLRDRTPLFRSESKRSQERETDFAPHRFIAPPPVESKPEKPAAAAPEAARGVVPPLPERAPERAMEREPAAPPRRFIPPAALDRPPEAAPQPAPQMKAPPQPESRDRAPRNIAPPPSSVESERPPASANGRHSAAPASSPEQQWEPPRFEPHPPRERPRGFSALGEDEPRPTPAQPFELDQSPAVSRFTPTAPAGHAPALEEGQPYWAVEPPVEPVAESAPPRFVSPPPVERAPEWPPASSANPMRTVAPPPFELEESFAPPPAAASPVSVRFSETAPSAAEPRRNHVPPSYVEETNFVPPPSAPRASGERPHDSSPQYAPGTRRATAPHPDSAPAPHSASPAPPEHTRHWSALFEEDLDRKRIESDMEPRRAAPSERKPSPTPEPAPASAESFRTAPPPASERPREKAPLFASEPWRSSASPLHEMESAPEWPHAAASHSIDPEPQLPPETAPAEENVDSGDPGDPMFPKLLKRLANVGRAALPIVPHVLPREGRIGATVSAVTAVSSALAAHAAAHHAPAAPTAPNVNLAPIGDNLDVLRSAQKELRDKVVDQTAVIERVQDQVDMLCEAANRVESEQRDLVAELKFFSKWALVFAVAVSVLLMASVAFEVVLILRQ